MYSLTDVKDDDGDSPLDVAIRRNKLSIAVYLISRGCGSDEDKSRSLIKACSSGELKVVKGLVEQCNVDPNGISLLHA